MKTLSQKYHTPYIAKRKELAAKEIEKYSGCESERMPSNSRERTQSDLELGNGYGYFCNIHDIENQYNSNYLINKTVYRISEKTHNVRSTQEAICNETLKNELPKKLPMFQCEKYKNQEYKNISKYINNTDQFETYSGCKAAGIQSNSRERSSSEFAYIEELTKQENNNEPETNICAMSSFVFMIIICLFIL